MPDPTTIRRDDLLAALDLLSITDTDNVSKVVMDGQYVTVTRYVRSLTGGILFDVIREDAATETTRIEIR